MKSNDPSLRRQKALAFAPVLARWVVGGCFIYMGLNKALNPIDFLKLTRQYGLVDTPWLLNLIAAGVPWFELWCGLLLVLGVAVRGAALLLVGMLVTFTGIVLQRAWAIQAAGGLAFCAIKFDCGCGTGEVYICGKLVENGLLLLLSCVLLCGRCSAWCWRYALFPSDRSSTL